MKKVLVTGANGFLGRHVIEELQKRSDVQVIAVDLSENETWADQVTYQKVNILSRSQDETLYQDLNSPDACIHLAWQDGFNHKADSHIQNLFLHYSFLKNMIDHGCQSISVMGTMHEIGYYEGAVKKDTPCNPMSAYGISKNALRQLMMTYCEGKEGVSLKWLRAYYITGDESHNHSVFTKILECEQKGQETFPFTDGKNKYDFLDVDILAEQIVQASLQNKVEGIINVCSGIPVSLKDKVENFISAKKLKIKPAFGLFPSRKYDSPAIWGDASLINKIMQRE